jgi:dsDNA-specific endonuclease/ATPase MutS2
LLDRIKKSLAELESRREEVASTLTSQMTSAEEDFEELARKTQEVQADAEEGLQKAAQVIAAFRTAVDTARSEFAQKQQAWAAAADGLEAEANEHVQAWTGGLMDLLARQATAMVQAANAMVDHHNDAMDGLKRRFAEQAPQDVGTALEPVEAALGETGQAAEMLEQGITQQAGALGSWTADSALPGLEDLSAALLAAAALE